MNVWERLKDWAARSGATVYVADNTLHIKLPLTGPVPPEFDPSRMADEEC